jgi:hypothetical protein
VAAANLLAKPLREGRVTEPDLAKVQARREWPTELTQRVQLIVQNRVIRHVLDSKGPLPAPWAVRLLAWFPFLRRIPARLIGLGVRPEHVHTPVAKPAAGSDPQLFRQPHFGLFEDLF